MTINHFVFSPLTFAFISCLLLKCWLCVLITCWVWRSTAGHQLLKLCSLISLVTINWQVMLNLYLCQLLFLGFALLVWNKRITTVAIWAWLCRLMKVHILDGGHRQTLYLCDGWPVLHCVFVMSNFIFGFSSCNPCKFKPAQFKFLWLNQMLWGKEINDEA